MFRQGCCLLLTLLLLAGCAGSGRYSIKNDHAPLRKPTTLEMSDATPKYEPIYPWSLKPYKVFGRKYHPLSSAQDYQAKGTASWYGRKFHGYHTANGEIYDMYAMTAAHKTLPIPSYVQVTNLANNRTIIVRVNDRGPFHDNRLIDLSYAAAYALDMLSTGTAEVKLQSIVVAEGEQYQPSPPPMIAQVATEPPAPPSAPPVEPIAQTTPALSETASLAQLFVQVLAASDGDKILATAKQLAQLFNFPRQIPRENGIYKLRLGPLKDKQQAQALINSLKNNGYPNAYMLYTKP